MTLSYAKITIPKRGALGTKHTVEVREDGVEATRNRPLHAQETSLGVNSPAELALRNAVARLDDAEANPPVRVAHFDDEHDWHALASGDIAIELFDDERGWRSLVAKEDALPPAARDAVKATRDYLDGLSDPYWSKPSEAPGY